MADCCEGGTVPSDSTKCWEFLHIFSGLCSMRFSLIPHERLLYITWEVASRTLFPINFSYYLNLKRLKLIKLPNRCSMLLIHYCLITDRIRGPNIKDWHLMKIVQICTHLKVLSGRWKELTEHTQVTIPKTLVFHHCLVFNMDTYCSGPSFKGVFTLPDKH